MARVEHTMTALECRCGALHEVVFSYVRGIGDYRVLCRGQLRTVQPHENTREVTLGLVDLRGGDGC